MTDSKRYTLAGVMGCPVDHSRSPVVHNHWIAQYGLRGAYVLLPVQPSSLREALRSLPLLGFSGCNLTIPHKVDAMSVVDHIDPLARRIGAVNTIVVEADGSLSGRNTDGYGFIQSLLDAEPNWSAGSGAAAVIGAGGAARAIIVSLLDSGCKEIRLTNRSWAKAHDMAQEFGSPVQAVQWESRHDALENVALLVNTTNQGMHGQPALDLALHKLSKQALVADAIYTPLETPLLEAARKRGNRTINGLGMLLNQARPAFEAWFGINPQITSDLLAKVSATF